MVDYEIPSLPNTINGRSSMRSIADAVEELRQAQRFSDESFAQIRTGPIRLPTGDVTSIVLVISQPRDEEPNWAVALPSSNFFSGRSAAGESERFEISRLDRAWVDGSRVQLADGTLLHAVNVIPTNICRALTEVEERILGLTIACIGAEDTCYRGLPDWLLPDWRSLDYAALYGLKLPPLKAIARYIADKDPTLRKVSRQTIANALSRCGMRRPRSGPLAA